MTASPDMVADAAVPDDDRTLVEQARAGGTGAFETLYRRHHARLYAVCMRLHGDRGHAEDAVQEAFVQAWQRLADFRGEAAFGTWLYRIAVNTALGRMRSQGRRDRHLQPVDDATWDNLAAPVHEPDAGMDLEAAIATLPDGARTVLVLHDVDGYGHQEIADMTGIAVGTSKAQLHRARRLLRERL